jgi:hypothetical protein
MEPTTPGLVRHFRFVCDVQEVVRQERAPMDAVGVRDTAPKLVPLRVMEMEPEEATLCGHANETIGSSKVKEPTRQPTFSLTVTATGNDTPSPIESM